MIKSSVNQGVAIIRSLTWSMTAARSSLCS